MTDLFTNVVDELDLLRQDPIFILGKLLTQSARAWSQLINFLNEDIEACSFVSQDQFSPAMEQLRYNASVIDRIKGCLEANQQVIEECGSASWSKTTGPTISRKILELQSSLQKNHVVLIRRCDQLTSRCHGSLGILVSAAQLLEAQRSINHAKQVHKLTKLAFIFFPLSFVALIFGMNVSALQNFPPIWVYFLIAIPLTACCRIGMELTEDLNRFWLLRRLIAARK